MFASYIPGDDVDNEDAGVDVDVVDVVVLMLLCCGAGGGGAPESGLVRSLVSVV